MRARVAWFVAGTTAGIYTTVKARRIAYRLTPSGISDQAGALGEGLKAFGHEVRAGMAEREAQIADELGLTAPALEQTPRPGETPAGTEDKDRP